MAPGKLLKGFLLLVIALTRGPLLMSSALDTSTETTSGSTAESTPAGSTTASGGTGATASATATNLLTTGLSGAAATNGTTASTALPSTSETAITLTATPTTNTTANVTMRPDMTTSNSTSAIVSMPPCRWFNCSWSSCYSMFTDVMAELVKTGSPFYKLSRLSDGNYSFSCSSFCNSTYGRCMNATETSCMVECCNTTACLNATLKSLNTSAGTTMAPSATTTAQSSATTAANGKKCATLTCKGDGCYKTATSTTAVCASGYDYCELKKVVSGSEMTWTASCSNSCLKSGLVTCSSTAVDCMQECCNATSTASCLKLNGSVNMPSSAGPATVPSLMALLTAALLVWVFNGQPWSPLRQ